MAKRLIWTLEAQNNRIEIFEYWNNRNKSKTFSRKLNEILREHIHLILNHPEIGILSDIENIRLKTVRDYQIVYLETEKEIVILAIWDSRQNPNKLAKKIYKL
jgi:toxin YoeB